MRSPLLLRFTALVFALAGCDGGDSDSRPNGPSDTHATRACDAASSSPTPVTAASSPDAVDAHVLASDAPYRVTMPETGAGYLSVRTAEEHVDLAFFSRERGVFAAFSGDTLGTSRKNGACPDRLLEDFRVHVHDPRDYLLTLSADAPREITILVMQTAAGHGPTDGGVHDHDGGHHHDDGAHPDGGTCGGAGTHCHDGADCCSGECDVDHCH